MIEVCVRGGGEKTNEKVCASDIHHHNHLPLLIGIPREHAKIIPTKETTMPCHHPPLELPLVSQQYNALISTRFDAMLGSLRNDSNFGGVDGHGEGGDIFDRTTRKW